MSAAAISKIVCPTRPDPHLFPPVFDHHAGTLRYMYYEATDGDWKAAILGLPLIPYVFIGLLACARPAPRPTLVSGTRRPAVPRPWRSTTDGRSSGTGGTMDCTSGSLRLVPVVVQQYIILVLCFPSEHVVPWIVGAYGGIAGTVVMYCTRSASRRFTASWCAVRCGTCIRWSS